MFVLFSCVCSSRATPQTAREPGYAPNIAAIDVAQGMDAYFKETGMAYLEPRSLDAIFEHLIANSGIHCLIVTILCLVMNITGGNTIKCSRDDEFECKQLFAAETNGNNVNTNVNVSGAGLNANGINAASSSHTTKTGCDDRCVKSDATSGSASSSASSTAITAIVVTTLKSNRCSDTRLDWVY